MNPPRGARRRARLAAERLAWVHPARSELAFANPYQLLIATILSAQTTDGRVNELTPRLFQRYPQPPALAGATLTDLEALLRPVGFFRVKAHAIRAAGRVLVAEHGGAVPVTMAELLTIPGVGRKTANAVLAVAFGVPGIVTDRHVIRVAHRAGLVGTLEPAGVEEQLRGLLPRREWTPFSLRGTRHGRYVCLARRPLCEQCVLNDFCPSSSTRTWPAPERLRLSLSLAARARPED